jgi:hypothetical protein
MHLKVAQSDPFEGGDTQGNDLGVSRPGVHTNKLNACLREFMPAAGLGLLVAENGPDVGATQWHRLVQQLGSGHTRDLRRKVRTQGYGPPLTIKEAVHRGLEFGASANAKICSVLERRWDDLLIPPAGKTGPQVILGSPYPVCIRQESILDPSRDLAARIHPRVFSLKHASPFLFRNKKRPAN